MSRPFRLTPRTEPERVAQCECTQMLERVLLPDVVWTAIDHSHSLNMEIGRNGRPIGIQEVVRRKKQGVKAGIPDYLFWYRARSFAIEFKIGDGRLSDAEKTFLRGLIREGTFCRVCWGSTQVMNTVWGWGLVRPQVHWKAAA
jgi:hypothetical protein